MVIDNSDSDHSLEKKMDWIPFIIDLLLVWISVQVQMIFINR